MCQASVTLVLDQNMWPPHPSLNPFRVHNLFSTGLPPHLIILCYERLHFPLKDFICQRYQR